MSGTEAFGQINVNSNYLTEISEMQQVGQQNLFRTVFTGYYKA